MHPDPHSPDPMTTSIHVARDRLERARRSAARILWATAAATVLAAGLAAWWVSGALAHTAPSGWAYDAACCNAVQAHPSGAVTGDCAPVPEGTVSARRDGWHITLAPGDHPRVPSPQSWTVPFSAAKPSGDGQHHVCAINHHLFCLYAAPGGV